MPRLLRPTAQSQTHGQGKKTRRCPARRQGQRRRMYRMGSGAAAESARRPASREQKGRRRARAAGPASRERQGQRRRMYLMGSGTAAESACRPASRERQGQPGPGSLRLRVLTRNKALRVSQCQRWGSGPGAADGDSVAGSGRSGIRLSPPPRPRPPPGAAFPTTRWGPATGWHSIKSLYSFNGF